MDDVSIVSRRILCLVTLWVNRHCGMFIFHLVLYSSIHEVQTSKMSVEIRHVAEMSDGGRTVMGASVHLAI